MSKHGKKYLEAKKKIDRSRYYEPLEAFQLLKGNAGASFDETAELSVKLGVNPKHADQQVRAVVCPTEQAKSLRWLCSPKGRRLRKLKKPERIL